MLVQSKSIMDFVSIVDKLSSDYLFLVFTLLLFLYYLCFSQFSQSYCCVGFSHQWGRRLKNDLSEGPMGWEEWRPRSLEHYHDTGAHTFPIHSKQTREIEEKREIEAYEEEIEDQEVDWRRKEDCLKETTTLGIVYWPSEGPRRSLLRGYDQ